MFNFLSYDVQSGNGADRIHDSFGVAAFPADLCLLNFNNFDFNALHCRHLLNGSRTSACKHWSIDYNESASLALSMQ